MGYTNSPLATYTRLTTKCSSGRGGQRLQRLTPHCIVGQWTAKQGCDYFATTDRDCSCNYVVGKDGDIGLCVEEKNRAWTTSSKDNDQKAITFECASDANHPYAFTTACYEALVKLCIDICQRYGIKKLLWFGDKNKSLSYVPAEDELVLTVHRWFANKSCPGDWMYSRMGELADRVTKALGTTVEAPKEDAPAPTDKTLYRVQCGAYSNKAGAVAQANKVRAAGFDAIVIKVGNLYKVQSGAYAVKSNANNQLKKIKAAGFDAFVTTVGGTVVNEGNKPQATTPSTDVSKTIWDFLKSKGLNDFAIAGIMGNLKAESSLNPKNLQQTYEKKLGYTDDSYTAAVDNGSYTNFVKDSAGYGLAQWTYWSRKQALLDYAKQVGKSIGDLIMQLEFMWKEMQGYTSMMKVLKSATSVRVASDAVLTQYEKPANQGESVQKTRASYGEAFYNKYATGSSGGVVIPEQPKKEFKPYTVKVDITDLNIRKGPGTNYAKTGEYTGRGIFTIVEEADGKGATKWGKLKSGAGWISLDYAKKR